MLASGLDLYGNSAEKIIHSVFIKIIQCTSGFEYFEFMTRGQCQLYLDLWCMNQVQRFGLIKSKLSVKMGFVVESSFFF